MYVLAKASALGPAAKRIGQTLVLLCLIAMLPLLGASLSHAHQAAAPNGIGMPPAPAGGGSGDGGPTSIAATNGDIQVGGATAPAPDATNGTLTLEASPRAECGAKRCVWWGHAGTLSATASGGFLTLETSSGNISHPVS